MDTQVSGVVSAAGNEQAGRIFEMKSEVLSEIPVTHWLLLLTGCADCDVRCFRQPLPYGHGSVWNIALLKFVIGSVRFERLTTHARTAVRNRTPEPAN